MKIRCIKAEVLCTGGDSTTSDATYTYVNFTNTAGGTLTIAALGGGGWWHAFLSFFF